MGSHELAGLLGWPRIAVLQISASQVARIQFLVYYLLIFY
jgi:hypothetical protein